MKVCSWFAEAFLTGSESDEFYLGTENHAAVPSTTTNIFSVG